MNSVEKAKHKFIAKFSQTNNHMIKDMINDTSHERPGCYQQRSHVELHKV